MVIAKLCEAVHINLQVECNKQRASNLSSCLSVVDVGLTAFANILNSSILSRLMMSKQPCHGRKALTVLINCIYCRREEIDAD